MKLQALNSIKKFKITKPSNGLKNILTEIKDKCQKNID